VVTNNKRVCGWCFKPLGEHERYVTNRLFCKDSCYMKYDNLRNRIRKLYSNSEKCDIELLRLREFGKNYRNAELGSLKVEGQKFAAPTLSSEEALTSWVKRKSCT
jgi:hypothetical protein